MLSIQNNTTPIDIGVLEVSSQNRAILGFFFESSGAELFNEVGIDQASAFIIDYDFPGAKESWDGISLTTQKPGIVLSVNEISLPNTIWVKKPLTAKLLIDAGTKIHEMIGSNNSQVVAPSVSLEETVVNKQKDVVNHKEVKVEMPALEALVAPLTAEEVATVEPTFTDSPSSSINNVPASHPKDSHKIAKTLNDISEPAAEEDEELDELDSLINSLNIENQNKLEIKTDKVDSLCITKAELEEPKLEIENLLNLESGNNIEFISDTEDTITEESISTDIKQENNSEFFDELVLDESPKETNDILEIREDIITSPTQSSTDSAVFDKDLSDSNTQADTDTDTDLQAMLDEIQQEMEGQDHSANTTSIGGTQNGEQQEYATTNAQDRWALLCGDKNRTKSTSEIKKDAYKLNNHLLANLLETIQEAKITQQVMRIKYEDTLIIIDTEIDTIYTDTSIYSEEYAKTCFEPVEHEVLKIHSLDSSETRMVHKKIETEPSNAYSIESFIWTTSLLTSRGRLLEHTNTNKVIGLKHWPNLTRIESFPHVMQIAAVFSKHPGNLIDVTKWLNIPQCYVFAFYNAAFSLNMIDLNTDILNKNNIKKVSFSFSKKGKSENRGLFSRLLSKIKG